MTKFFKIAFLALLLVVLVAGTALAGTLQINTTAASTPANVSLQIMGSSRTVPLVQSAVTAAFNTANAAITYTPGTALAAGDLLVLTASGFTFPAGTLYACAANNASVSTAMGTANGIEIGYVTLASASSNATITLEPQNAANSNVSLVVLTYNACTGSNAANSAGNVTATSVAGNATLSAIEYASGGTVVKDTMPAVTVYSVEPEFTYGAVGAATPYYITYTQGSANGSQLTALRGTPPALVTATIPQVANFTYTAQSAANVSGTGLTVAGLISVVDTSSFEGLSNVYLTNAATACALGSNVAANTAPSGLASVNLAISSAAFNATSGSNFFQLCMTAANNQVLQTRTITVTPNITMTGAGNQPPAAGSPATMSTWSVDAYQAFIPYLNASTSYTTSCIISNTGTSAATVLMNITSDTAGAASTVLTSSSAITIPGTTTKRIDFDTNVTPWTTGTSETAGTPIATISSGRYAALVTITGTPANINMTCFRIEPNATNKTPVPVYINGTNAPWLQ